jgi:hypothetical protein
MTIAADLHRDIASFLTDMGRAVTLRRLTPGTYDPATGSGGSATTTDYTGKARIGDYSDAVKNGTLIKENDRKATFQPDNTAIVPAIGDSLIVGSDTYAVVNAMKTRELGGTAICYTLQLRR